MARRTLLLVSPPVLHAARWWGNRIANKPHLDSLAGYVRDLADVRIVEMDIVAGAPEAEQLARFDEQLDELLRGSLGLVGISCWTSMHFLGACAVARRVRSLAPRVPIVVGGHHATAAPEDFTSDLCDWVVRGDGEAPLRALCREWPQRPAQMEILTGGVFDQSNPEHIDWERYGRPDRRDHAVWVGLSRGCPFQCRFCVEPQRGVSTSRYSVEDSLDIVERLARTRAPRAIAFSDPLFGASRRWTEAFLDGLERRDLPLMFWAETRADLMTPELLERFKRCRFKLDFGLDAASVTMVERMEKSPDAARYLARSRELFQHANAIGLPHGIYLIFNFPGETPATSRQARAFIDGIGAGRGSTSGWLSAQTFFILPGTSAFLRMKENAAAYGTKIRHPRWWAEAGDHYGLATDVLPSRSWKGHEHQLRAFEGWNQRVNAGWVTRYPAEVTEFCRVFDPA
jgi:radical SAM superfamily enzyme YgiQ (UPF0313 family)